MKPQPFHDDGACHFKTPARLYMHHSTPANSRRSRVSCESGTGESAHSGQRTKIRSPFPRGLGFVSGGALVVRRGVGRLRCRVRFNGLGIVPGGALITCRNVGKPRRLARSSGLGFAPGSSRYPPRYEQAPIPCSCWRFGLCSEWILVTCRDAGSPRCLVRSGGLGFASGGALVVRRGADKPPIPCSFQRLGLRPEWILVIRRG